MPAIVAGAGGSAALLLVVAAIAHRKRGKSEPKIRKGGVRKAARKGSLRLQALDGDLWKGSQEKIAVMTTQYHSDTWDKQGKIAFSADI